MLNRRGGWIFFFEPNKFQLSVFFTITIWEKKELLHYGLFIFLSILLSFAIAFIVIGQQLKWKKEHFRKIKSSRIWIIYVITWVLAVYGLWLDFYAGSMFLFFGFILIGIESSRKEINWVNIILAIINISLSLIAFIMHLQYTVKLNF